MLVPTEYLFHARRIDAVCPTTRLRAFRPCPRLMLGAFGEASPDDLVTTFADRIAETIWRNSTTSQTLAEAAYRRSLFTSLVPCFPPLASSLHQRTRLSPSPPCPPGRRPRRAYAYPSGPVGGSLQLSSRRVTIMLSTKKRNHAAYDAGIAQVVRRPSSVHTAGDKRTYSQASSGACGTAGLNEH